MLQLSVYFGISLIVFLLVGCDAGNNSPSASGATVSIAISPASISITKGDTANLTAIESRADGKTAYITGAVTWTSANPATASVSSAGLVTGVAPGSTTITASLNGVTSPAATINVADANLIAINVSPASASVTAGSFTTFAAEGTYSDGTTRNISNLVIWNSDRPAVATINRRGSAASVGAGSSSITAKLDNLISNAVTLTVVYSVGGTLNGLASGKRILLTNNGADKIILRANGPFSFPTRLAEGSAYQLAIAALPKRQPCTHTYGAGKIQTANMPGIRVICGFPPQGEAVMAANLTAARRDHTTTLLAGGKVLATGGVGVKDNLASAELYDPVADRWVATGALAVARRNHTTTLLPDGKVLATGGFDTAFTRLASAELYDPATGRWTETGSLAAARSLHTATLLANGKVLVTGGVGVLGVGTLASAELYDPATGRWTETGSLAAARSLHTAVLLPDGKVLVMGGVGVASAGTLTTSELYDPTTGNWTSTGTLSTARSQHTATLLPSGKVLVAGGIGTNGNLVSAELYNPANGRWDATGSLASMRYLHTAILLPTGKVLVAGGVGAAESGTLASAELYDPKSGRWTATGSFTTARSQYAATLLSIGKLLVTGGNGVGNAVLAGAELYW
ncbi:MAG: Ig-like domain-containing protein [Gammaproteobacteria bacterium]|nr:Ig-like domain-containing protein [Gammaproteobacteria bacterium]MBU1482677.1 Ig-like domain-containing protein [Gammaproteobacteria bacterium]